MLAYFNNVSTRKGGKRWFLIKISVFKYKNIGKIFDHVKFSNRL